MSTLPTQKNIFILFYFISNYLFSSPHLAAHIYFIHLISNFFLTLSLTNILSAISVFLSLSFLVFIFCLFPPNTYSHILLLVYFLVFFSHISSLCYSLSLFILRRLLLRRPSFTTDSYPQISQRPDCS